MTKNGWCVGCFKTERKCVPVGTIKNNYLAFKSEKLFLLLLIFYVCCQWDQSMSTHCTSFVSVCNNRDLWTGSFDGYEEPWGNVTVMLFERFFFPPPVEMSVVLLKNANEIRLKVKIKQIYIWKTKTSNSKDEKKLSKIEKCLWLTFCFSFPTFHLAHISFVPEDQIIVLLNAKRISCNHLWRETHEWAMIECWCVFRESSCSRHSVTIRLFSSHW